MEKYKTVGPRFVALIIDAVLMFPIIIAAPFLSSFFDFSPLLTTIFSNFTGIISVVYVVLMHTFYGQTIGKIAVHVKVLDKSEKPIFFGQAVLRSLPQITSIFFILTFSPQTAADESDSTQLYVMLFWVIYITFEIVDIIVFFVDKKHRALHDLIAGTVVIRTDI